MRLSIFPIAAPLLFASALLASCKPEQVKPTESTKEVSKYDLIPGNYKMYDTLGNYLYDLNIKHFREKSTNLIPRDSLLFTNFDGKYSFKTLQNTGSPANEPNYSFRLGVHDSLRDNAGKRTLIFGISAVYSNDSIYIHFERDNMKYYLADMVPYNSCDCQQIGVKQH